MIGPVLRLKSDNEVLRGLRNIEDFWLFAVGGQRASLGRIERHDIKTLELRCPALCASDRDFLQPLHRRGEIFRRFSAPERDQIWQQLLEYTAFVPSFYSFFENLKYLMAIAGCLKEPVGLEYRQTVADAFEEAFRSDTQTATGDSGRDEQPSGIPREMRGNIAYRHLVLYIMQQLELLDPDSILLDDGPKVAFSASAVARHELAALAHRLGFRSVQIADKMSQDPYQAAARQALLSARASVVTDCSEQRMTAYSVKIAKVFKEFQKSVTVAPNPALLSSESGEKLERRRGCPLQKAHEQSCQPLTLDHVHGPDPDGLGEPTAFFVRRDIYLFFFGKLHQSGSETLVQASLNLRTTSAPSSPLQFADQGRADEQPHHEGVAALTIHRGQPVETSASPMDTESVYTDASLPPSEEANLTETGGNDDGEVPGRVRFVLYDQGHLRLVHEVPIDGEVDSRMESAAANFMRQSLVLMDRDTRTLAPSQCLRSVLDDSSLTVYLVPAVDMNQVPDLERTIAGMKRRASDDLDAQSRPRKIQVTGDAQSQYLIAKHGIW